eukprot:159119-Prorocentrum_minimum.AAC.1
MWVLQRKVFNRLNVLHAEQVQRRKEELVANVPIFKMLDAAHRQTIVEALIPVLVFMTYMSCELPTGDTAD